MDEAPDLFGACDVRAALEAQWRKLTDCTLPKAATRDWPVHLNHCFQRVLLDDATGGVWYDAIPQRPAYVHAPMPVLERAIATGEAVLAGHADLHELNRRSLSWRRKRREKASA